MANGLMGSTVAYITVALITQYEGTQAVGLYSAALALSGMFINFVLGAMGADYYPRLTAAATDKAAMNRMVNEQTEIGLLLAMPGLLATMTLAPWIIQIFYSKEFLPAVGVLQLFILGCIGRIISWPLGYIMISLKKNSLYLFSEFTWNILHITLIFLGLLFFDIQGVSFALPLLYIIVTIQSKIIARKLIGFKWNTSSIRLIFSYLFILLSLLLYCRSADVFSSTVVGSIISIGSTIHSLRSIINRIGKENKYIKKLYKIRIFNFILPVA
jgi:PST family polysaccharide transporter